MRVVVQRVKSASVTTTENRKVVSSIGPGIVALVGLHQRDTPAQLQECCKQLLSCKLWENDKGSGWRQSVIQQQFQILLVSQFTLYGTTSRKGTMDYQSAMKTEPARTMYDQFVSMVREAYEAKLQNSGKKDQEPPYPASERVMDGVFGAMMEVELVNDGPVTLVLESEPPLEQEIAADS